MTTRVEDGQVVVGVQDWAAIQDSSQRLFDALMLIAETPRERMLDGRYAVGIAARTLREDRPVGELPRFVAAVVTDGMVERAAEAMEDAAVQLLGRDLGTVHRGDIARAALEAALGEGS